MTCATVQLADGLTIHFPGDGRDSHVLELADHRLLRVGADAARFAEWLSAHPGEVDAAAVAADLGPAWTPGAVEALINALITSGAVRPTDEAPPERRRPGRVRISGPLSVQFTLANPTRVYTPIAGWLHRMIPAIGTAVGALSVAGVLLLTWMMGQPDAPIFEPASAGTYLWTMVLLYLTVAIHEFSHGAVLVSYGGMPRRMGAMLFYLTPAFFCDVTDAWLLAPGKRVWVAMAGILAQCTLGGLALAASLLASGDLRTLLAGYGALSILYGVINVVPFVKMDGYIAMAGWLEWPHLRADAITSFNNVARRLLGGAPTPLRRNAGWLPWFGLGCVLFPLILVSTIAGTVIALLLSYPSTLNAVGGLVLVLGVLIWVLIKPVRGLRDHLRAGASPARTAGLAAAMALVIGLAAGAPVGSQTLAFGVWNADGPRLVTQQRALAAPLGVGQSVQLHTGALVVGPKVATAVVAGPAFRCSAPVSALFAMKGADEPLDAWCVPVRVTTQVTGPMRHARVELNNQSLIGWVDRTFIRPITLELFP